MFHASMRRPVEVLVPQQTIHGRLPSSRQELAHLYTPAEMTAAIGEPIAAGIVVSLFNKYILNGRWRLQCCCAPEEAPEREELRSNSSGSCPSSEAGAINADIAYNHIHVDGG